MSPGLSAPRVQATVQHGGSKGPPVQSYAQCNKASTPLHSHAHITLEISHCLTTCLQACAGAKPCRCSGSCAPTPL